MLTPTTPPPTTTTRACVFMSPQASPPDPLLPLDNPLKTKGLRSRDSNFLIRARDSPSGAGHSCGRTQGGGPAPSFDRLGTRAMGTPTIRPGTPGIRDWSRRPEVHTPEL